MFDRDFGLIGFAGRTGYSVRWDVEESPATSVNHLNALEAPPADLMANVMIAIPIKGRNSRVIMCLYASASVKEALGAPVMDGIWCSTSHFCDYLSGLTERPPSTSGVRPIQSGVPEHGVRPVAPVRDREALVRQELSDAVGIDADSTQATGLYRMFEDRENLATKIDHFEFAMLDR